MVLYDITASYLEGAYEESEIVLFGYNRDGKRGHEQICLGLLCNEQGCPVGVEVFAGNTQDASTVLEKIKELRTEYGLNKVIFVGDRGMVTSVGTLAVTIRVEVEQDPRPLRTLFGANLKGRLLIID